MADVKEVMRKPDAEVAQFIMREMAAATLSGETDALVDELNEVLNRHKNGLRMAALSECAAGVLTIAPQRIAPEMAEAFVQVFWTGVTGEARNG